MKRLLSMLLALVLALGLLPASAFAAASEEEALGEINIFNGGYRMNYLATLKIPSIGVNVKVYEGTGTTPLAKGAGHFTDTSIWDGNVCIAAHNRGAHAQFGKIHTLSAGDRVTLTTKLGTRTY